MIQGMYNHRTGRLFLHVTLGSVHAIGCGPRKSGSIILLQQSNCLQLRQRISLSELDPVSQCPNFVYRHLHDSTWYKKSGRFKTSADPAWGSCHYERPLA